MKRVVSEKLKIQFIESRILDFQSNQQFDIICTFYFLDLFLKQELLQTIEKLKMLLKKSGKWLYADFYLDDKSPCKHKFVVKLMFIFFETVANIQSQELFDLQLCIMKKGFTRLLHSKFKKGLIQSSVFGKG